MLVRGQPWAPLVQMRQSGLLSSWIGRLIKIIQLAAFFAACLVIARLFARAMDDTYISILYFVLQVCVEGTLIGTYTKLSLQVNSWFSV